MNTTDQIPFNLTEEAFLLNCTKEVMKVWASKSGKAKMNIIVNNGSVDLQLDFKLGPPRDPHLPPRPHQPQTPPRFKTPARKEKDRARAAAHQQAQLLKTSFQAADSGTSVKSSSANSPQVSPPPSPKSPALSPHSVPHCALLNLNHGAVPRSSTLFPTSPSCYSFPSSIWPSPSITPSCSSFFQTSGFFSLSSI